VSRQEIEEAAYLISDELKAAIRQAKDNIEAFHKKQVEVSGVVETMPGVKCWRKTVAIEKVGLYIPGGTAPLFSTLLMLGGTCQDRRLPEIVLCSPPDRQGHLHPAILYAAQLVGVSKIFKVGVSRLLQPWPMVRRRSPKCIKFSDRAINT